MKLDERIRPIRTENDYNRALSVIDDLIDVDPASEDYAVFDVVSELVHAYEEKHLPMPQPTPIATINFQMDQHFAIT